MKAADDVRQELKRMADLDKAKILQRFFKTGPGQYVEDYIFIGVIVPQSRQVAEKFSQLPLSDVRVRLFDSTE